MIYLLRLFVLSALLYLGCITSLANASSPFGKVYTQCLNGNCYGLGVASYHFESPELVWINWEEFNFTINSQPIKKKQFEQTEFDENNRTFYGKIIFEDSLDQPPHRGESLWDFKMIFDENYEKIIEGELIIHHRFGRGLTKRKDYGEDWYFILSN